MVAPNPVEAVICALKIQICRYINLADMLNNHFVFVKSHAFSNSGFDYPMRIEM